MENVAVRIRNLSKRYENGGKVTKANTEILIPPQLYLKH
jgi:hypothetical protein